MGEEEVVAPALEKLCGGDGLVPEARRISRASRNGLLKCAVCGTAVKKVFGIRRRWHFALMPGAALCDHESETLWHRETKLALYRGLSHHLLSGWNVHLEKRLENGRRPDVLAVHKENGARVAFEVQYADLSSNGWRERHEDYASIGVRDVWMLGHAREGSRRDALAHVLAAAEEQRVVYVGRREGAGEVLVREAIFEGGLSRVGLPYAELGAAIPGTLVAGWQGLSVAEWVEYGLDAVSLSEDGTLRTPADDAFEQLRVEAEWERLWEEKRRKAAEQRWRAAASRFGDERFLERQQRINRWLTSPHREEARAKLGRHLLNLLEREEDLDRAVLAHSGEWKVWLFIKHLHGKVQGNTFDLEVATEELLERFGATGRISDFVEAVHLFVLLLQDEGFLANPKAGIASPRNGRRRYVVIGTAEGWTRRLEERIRRSRG